jgi:hypothetical protein
MAEIINLVDARASRAAAAPPADMGARSLRPGGANPAEEIGPQPRKSLVLRRIEEVADVFGIDVSGPFGRKPVR